MGNNCHDCEENNIPTVNEEAIECCEFYPADCVKTSAHNSYFKIGVGKSLTYVIDKIAKYVKKLSQRIDEHHNYVEWEGLLSQSAADAPEEVVGKNTLSGKIAFTRVTDGEYLGTLVGAFPVDKTFITIGSFDRSWGEDVKAFRLDDDNISIRTGNSTDFIDDDVLDNTPIYIKVYN
jgi:hypothetical protein